MADRVLMIDDDQELAGMVARYLSPFGMEVTARGDAESGLALLRRGGFEAVILDVMLPDLDGLEVCRRVRADSDIPVLMLNPRELLARLRALLRRRQPGAPGARLRFGRLEIDREARMVRKDGEPRALTSYQFDLLCALAESAGRVLSRDALMGRVRGTALEAFDRSIDVHVSRIRAAIEDDPRHPRRIITVRGAGYVFAREPDEPA
jgi:DNA-binding response OmpR family regulator